MAEHHASLRTTLLVNRWLRATVLLVLGACAAASPAHGSSTTSDSSRPAHAVQWLQAAHVKGTPEWAEWRGALTRRRLGGRNHPDRLSRADPLLSRFAELLSLAPPAKPTAEECLDHPLQYQASRLVAATWLAVDDTGRVSAESADLTLRLGMSMEAHECDLSAVMEGRSLVTSALAAKIRSGTPHESRRDLEDAMSIARAEEGAVRAHVRRWLPLECALTEPNSAGIVAPRELARLVEAASSRSPIWMRFDSIRLLGLVSSFGGDAAREAAAHALEALSHDESSAVAGAARRRIDERSVQGPCVSRRG